MTSVLRTFQHMLIYTGENTQISCWFSFWFIQKIFSVTSQTLHDTIFQIIISLWSVILHWSGSDNIADCWVLQNCCWRTTKIRPPGSSKIANRLIGDLECSHMYLRLQSWTELSVNDIPHDSTHPPYNITPNNKTVLLTQERKIGRISLQEVRCTSWSDIHYVNIQEKCTLHCAWWVIFFAVAYT